MKSLANDPNKSHHRNINLQELKLMVQGRATKSSNDIQKDQSFKNLSRSFHQPSSQNMMSDNNKKSDKKTNPENPQVQHIYSLIQT